ncbi:hypothetical protein [Silvimonas amylolytica]|uniref:Uncharacterized protein n=1 Tax=Silvimonas amylolytica TaxID=449663 RepID=A0ABQ2PK34_9NEIS|nr:hypothetical protein [Silvimonas amylolytica]GGP25581.1 hypothetical protein GCM10010971_14000 [Silvimonas amylolytica]
MSTSLQADSTPESGSAYPKLITTSDSLTLSWQSSSDQPWVIGVILACLTLFGPGLMLRELLFAHGTSQWTQYIMPAIMFAVTGASLSYWIWRGASARHLRICSDGTLVLGLCTWRFRLAPSVLAVNGETKSGPFFSLKLCFRHFTLHLPAFPNRGWRDEHQGRLKQWLQAHFPATQPYQSPPRLERGLLAGVLTAAVAVGCFGVVLWVSPGIRDTLPDVHGPLAPLTTRFLLLAWSGLVLAWWMLVVPGKDADLLAEPGTVVWISVTFVFLAFVATFVLTYFGQRQAALETPGVTTVWLAHPSISSAKHCPVLLTVNDPVTGQTVDACSLQEGIYRPGAAAIEVQRVTNRYGTTDTLLRMASAPD